MKQGQRQWQRFLERLEDYRDFLHGRGYHHLLTDPEGRLIFADSREIAGLRVGIVGFNSAWSCCQDGEKARLWAGGHYQLEELQGRLGTVDFTVSLIHHPGNWFVEQEDPDVQRLLEREFQFVLHGHEHKDWVKCDATTGHTTLSAGACYDRSDRENGYSVVRLDRATGTGEVWLRRFDRDGGGWVTREVSGRTRDGRWPLDCLEPWFGRLRSTSPGKDTATENRSSTRKVAGESARSGTAAEEYERRFRRAMIVKHDYLELFGADLTRVGSRQYSLSVAYVSLNLSDEDESYEDEVDTEELDSAESLDFHGSLPVEDVFDRLRPDSGRLLVRGVAGCGKSTLLRWATIEAAKQEPGKLDGASDWRSKVPFLIRLRDCDDGKLPRPQDFPALLAKELPDPTLTWIDEVLTSGRGLVMLDGVDEVPAKFRTRVQKEIRAIVDAYPKCYYIVSTRPGAVERHWLTSLGFSEARVEPMSAPDREIFVDKWHEAVADQLRERRQRAENLEELAVALKRQLRASPQIARLAIYPLLCAMICALHRERNQELPETQARLCEDLCQMLLDRRERETPGLSMDHLPPAYRRLDYEHKKYVVAELAHFMLVDLEGASSLTEVDAETRIAEALTRFPDHRDADPVEVRRGLIERSGLLRPAESGRIDFLHNTLKEYLAAERFVAERAYGLLARHANHDAWQPVILFAAALPDPDFASRLMKKLLAKSPSTNQKAQAKRRSTKAYKAQERARQFFILRVRNIAFRLDPKLVECADEIAKAVLPPRTIPDAEALAACGESVVPFLRPQEGWNVKECVACLRALRLIGGPAATRCVEEFGLSQIKDKIGRELFQTAAALSTTIAMSKFSSLDLTRTQVSDLTPLAGCAELQSLYLRSTQVSDLTPLAGCPALQSLNLRGTWVSGLTPLAGCSVLQSLDLRGTQVSDLTPLVGCSALQSLNLSGTQVSDLTPLARCSTLQSLNLYSTKVSDLTPLAGCSALQSLDLYATQVSDLTPLAGCSTLQSLDLRGTQVSDLSPLAGCAELQLLDFRGTQVSDLSPLAGCAELQSLNLSGTQVSDLTPLTGCSALRSLNLGGTQVSQNQIERLKKVLPHCNVHKGRGTGDALVGQALPSA